MTAPTNAAASTGDLLHESKITPTQWLILLLCVVASMLEGFDIVIIAYTAPAISADWGITFQELGVVLSAGLFGMTLGAMLLSWLADRYGRRIVVSATLLIAGVTTSAVVYVDTVMELAVLRVIAGLALGVLVATLPALVGEFSPRRHRTLVVSVLIAAASMGAVIGGLMSAAYIPDYGWKALFLGAGVLTVLIAVLVQLLVPESIAFLAKRRPEGALEKINRALTYLGQPTIAQLPPVVASERQEPASVVSLLTSTRRATTLLSWSAFFSGFLVVYFLSSWMPQILVNAGLSQREAIQATAVIPFGSIIGTMLFGWLAKWWSLSRLVAIGFVIGAVCIFALSGMSSELETMPFIVISAMLCLIGISLMGAFSNLYAVVMTVYPVQVRSTGLGWAAGLGRAGAVVSPMIAGFMVGVGVSIPALFLYFALPALVAALCVYFIRMREMA